MFQFGQKLRDRVTGYEGIATSRVEYLNGCIQYCIKAPLREGKIDDGYYFDSQQLQCIDEGIVEMVEKKITGGPAVPGTPTNYCG